VHHHVRRDDRDGADDDADRDERDQRPASARAEQAVPGARSTSGIVTQRRLRLPA
jgi:hypothetical protein